MHHRTHTQDTPWHPVKRDVAGIDLCGKGPVWNDVSLRQRVVNVANGPEMHTVAPRSATALKDTAPEQEKQAMGNPTATPEVTVRQPYPSE